MDDAQRRAQDDRWRLLQRMEVARTNQNVVVWTVVSIFAAAHALLFQSFVTARAAAPEHARLAWTVAIVGVVASGVTGVLVDRAIRFLTLHETVVADVERALGLVEKFRLCEGTTARRAIFYGSFGAKQTLRLFSVLVVAGWSAAAVFMAYLLWPASTAFMVASCLTIGTALGVVAAVNLAA